MLAGVIFLIYISIPLDQLFDEAVVSRASSNLENRPPRAVRFIDIESFDLQK